MCVFLAILTYNSTQLNKSQVNPTRLERRAELDSARHNSKNCWLSAHLMRSRLFWFEPVACFILLYSALICFAVKCAKSVQRGARKEHWRRAWLAAHWQDCCNELRLSGCAAVTHCSWLQRLCFELGKRQIAAYLIENKEKKKERKK